MNKNILSIAAVVIVVALGVWIYFTWKPAGPEQTVQSFYNEWINSPTNLIAEGGYRTMALLTDNAKSKIDSVVRSFDGQGSYDPVLCAQDKPQSFTLVNDSTIGDKSQVTVVENFSGRENRVTVSLIKEGATWKIDDINCGAGSGDQALLSQVGDYIRGNISTLSPAKAATGTEFQINDIRFVDEKTALVNYDDGQNAYQARVTFTATTTATTTNIKVNSFQLDEESGGKG